MKVLIQDVIIKDRVRTDIGDLKPLMESMRDHGQLNPVTLSRENELIAGHRRTLAARELGWKYIEASVVDKSSEADQLRLELEENVHRKDFSPEELLAGYRRLDKLLHPPLVKRIGRAIGSFFRKLFPWGRKRKTQWTGAEISGDVVDKGSSASNGIPSFATKRPLTPEQDAENYGI